MKFNINFFITRFFIQVSYQFLNSTFLRFCPVSHEYHPVSITQPKAVRLDLENFFNFIKSATIGYIILNVDWLHPGYCWMLNANWRILKIPQFGCVGSGVYLHCGWQWQVVLGDSVAPNGIPLLYGLCKFDIRPQVTHQTKKMLIPCHEEIWMIFAKTENKLFFNHLV